MEQPKQIFKFEKYVEIVKIPMVQKEDGTWEEDRKEADMHFDEMVREWFEDENGVELEMEEI